VTEFLSEKGIMFEEIDVRKTPRAVEELIRLGVMATPVLVTGDQVLVGFDPDAIERIVASMH
jgi:arsenate reductase-like glutaredoxin family protein